MYSFSFQTHSAFLNDLAKIFEFPCIYRFTQTNPHTPTTQKQAPCVQVLYGVKGSTWPQFFRLRCHSADPLETTRNLKQNNNNNSRITLRLSVFPIHEVATVVGQ